MANTFPDVKLEKQAAAGPGASADIDAVCTTDETTTAAILKAGYSHGTVRVPNGSSITSITWYAKRSSSDTAVALYDQDGVAVSQTVAADRVVELNTALAGCKYAVPKTDAAGTLYVHLER